MYYQPSFINLIATEQATLSGVAISEIQEFIIWIEAAMLVENFSVFSNLRALRIACMQEISDRPTAPKQSVGHVEFIGDFEFFLFNEELYKARISNAFDIQGRRLGARWEAPSWMVESKLETYRSFIWQPVLI